MLGEGMGMKALATLRVTVCLAICAMVLGGCSAVSNLLGYPTKGDPSVQIKASGPRWLLIKNPRFGDVASEPEYIWVEEDKLPTTMKTLVFGKSSLVAPPEIVARYGPPPGGGQISPRQRVAQNVEPAPVQSSAPASGAGAPGTPPAGAAAASNSRPRGLVLYVDSDRVVIDLTERDGLKLGSLVSLRRDSIPIVHPVTGELLGELDQELATGKVTEVREKFSVVEIQAVSPGAEIRIKDRVVVR
jgi:hypothetical protein